MPHRLSSVMSKPFFVATSKPTRAGEAIDVAARHFVYKLYEATNGRPGVWHALSEIGEAKVTVARAGAASSQLSTAIARCRGSTAYEASTRISIAGCARSERYGIGRHATIRRAGGLERKR